MPATAIIIRLLEATLKSSAVLVLAFAATSLLRSGSAALRHLVWVMAIGAAVAIPLLPSLLPAWRVLPVLSNATASFEPLPTPVDGEHVAGNLSQSSAPMPALRPPIYVSTPVPTPKLHSPAVSRSSLKAVALCSWFFGMLYGFAYYGLGRLRLQRLAQRASRILHPDWMQETEIAALRLGIRRSVMLLCSKETEIPLTFGVIHPKVILPIDANDWHLHRKRAVLQHEMAHVARFDALTQALSHLACTLYWFNPMVWLATRSAQFERERACDDQVLAAGSKPSEYARDLLAMAAGMQKPEHHAAALAMARQSQIEGRLLALLNPRLSHQSISRSKTLFIAGIAALVVLPLAAISSSKVATPPVVSLSAQPGEEAKEASGLRSIAPSVGAAGIASSGRSSVETAPVRPASGSEMTTTPPGQKSSTVVPPYGNRTGFECDEDSAGSHNFSSHSNSDSTLHTWDVSWSKPGCATALNSQGDITFDSEFTDIQTISPGGFLSIDSNIRGDVRHLSIHPSPSGALDYVWSVNGSMGNFDDEGHKWLANFLIAMDRQTASAVNQRFPQLLQEGGPDRVLEEVSYMESDYARATYLQKLLHGAALIPHDVQLILARTAEMSSDYQRSQLLVEMAHRRLIDASLQTDFLRSANEIKSDYEHSRTLLAFLEMRPTDDAALLDVIRTVPQIKADHEASRVLITVAGQRRLEGTLRQEYVAAAQGIRTDSARNQALNAIGYRR